MPLKAHILQHSNTHRWELPVGNYPGNSGNYHYPFFWVIFMVILHDFIFKNYHENQSDCYPFFVMVNYPKEGVMVITTVAGVIANG